MRSSAEPDEPIFAPLDWLLAAALVFCIMAMLIHSLFSTPASAYAAAPSPPASRVYAEDTSKIIRTEHALMAAHQHQAVLDAWHAQVIADAKAKAAKIAAAKAAAARAAQAPTVLSVSSSAFANVGYGEPDSVPGVPAGSYAACVAWRESSDIATEPDGLFGFLASTTSWMETVSGSPIDGWSGSSAGSFSVSTQIQMFAWEYARYGHSAWPDGC